MSEIYTISVSFGGVFPNTQQLSSEIIADSINITTGLIGIGTEDDVVTIIFASQISPGEKLALDTIVANHVPNNDPIPNDILPIIPRISTITEDKYRRIVTFRFPGSTFARVNTISCMEPGVDSYDIRIVDRDNGALMLTTNLTNTIESTQQLGTLSNLSIDETTLQVYVKRNGGLSHNKIHIENINIEYVSIR